jgi:hypothetical protein
LRTASEANRQIRSLAPRVDLVGSRPIWPAHVGCLAIQTDPDRSCRIVWMIKRMIKQARQLDEQRGDRAQDSESGPLPNRRRATVTVADDLEPLSGLGGRLRPALSTTTLPVALVAEQAKEIVSAIVRNGVLWPQEDGLGPR